MMFFGGVVQPRGQQAAAGRRVPRAGAARRQITRTDPPPASGRARRALLDAHAPGCLYARVDVGDRRRPIRADGGRARRAEPVPRARPAARPPRSRSRSSASRNRLRGWSAPVARSAPRKIAPILRGSCRLFARHMRLPIKIVHRFWTQNVRLSFDIRLTLLPLIALPLRAAARARPRRPCRRRRHHLDGRRSRRAILLAEPDDDARRADVAWKNNDTTAHTQRRTRRVSIPARQRGRDQLATDDEHGGHVHTITARSTPAWWARSSCSNKALASRRAVARPVLPDRSRRFQNGSTACQRSNFTCVDLACLRLGSTRPRCA